MASYTRKEFAELIGLEFNKDTRAKIATWIKRGNIIITNDQINDTIQQNLYWIQKQASRVPKESIKIEMPKAEVTTEKISTDKNFKKKSGTEKEPSRYNLEIEKKELEIEKLKVDTRLQELKEEKIRGEVIPVVLVKQIFSALMQSIITSQKDFIENMLINISKEYRLSGTQLAFLRGKMVKELNAGVDKSINMAQRDMKLLVAEYSIKKEVGERE